LLATITGNFRNVQHGSAWWFNDHYDGMIDQMKSLASVGALNKFIGMLTDSRSFLSYTRHDYFRRILCNLIGEWVENGQFINDMDVLTKLVEDISFNNAKNFLGI
jgi:glucuronate isomerase